MKMTELIELAEKIEKLPSYDAALTREAFEIVKAEFSDIDRSLIEAGALGSVDSVMLLVDHALPGWAVKMSGVASENNGHWMCSLRQSEVRDSDAFLGLGNGPVLSNALISALLKALIYSSKFRR